MPAMIQNTAREEALSLFLRDDPKGRRAPLEHAHGRLPSPADPSGAVIFGFQDGARPQGASNGYQASSFT